VWRPWREKWVVLEIIIQSCSKKERGKVSGVDNSVDKIVYVLFAFENQLRQLGNENLFCE
jgi:hypothetical protein